MTETHFLILLTIIFFNLRLLFVLFNLLFLGLTGFYLGLLKILIFWLLSMLLKTCNSFLKLLVFKLYLIGFSRNFKDVLLSIVFLLSNCFYGFFNIFNIIIKLFFLIEILITSFLYSSSLLLVYTLLSF